MKKLIINLYKITLLFSLVLLTACSGGRSKRVRLNNFSNDLSKHGKLIVTSLKRTEKRIDMKLLGISLGAKSIVIKANEIRCGAGDVKFKKANASGNNDNIIILPKLNYVEFEVFCINDEEVSKDLQPYIFFKKLYELEDSKQGKVLDSNVKIIFE